MWLPRRCARLQAQVSVAPAWLQAFDAEDLLIVATRYYVRRLGLAGARFPHTLAHAWPELPAWVQHALKRELETAFTSDDYYRAHGKTVALPLGTDADRALWELVRAAWQAAAEPTT